MNIKTIILLGSVSLALFTGCAKKDTVRNERWTKEKAQAWWSAQEWPVGCNYVPSYAINQFEFWQEETFDPEVIDSELALAEDLGFNTLRIYLHEQLWYADKLGFKSRIDKFLNMAQAHGMKLIITFFTNGGNHTKEFKLGPQPEAIPGIHNSNWIPSPGKAVIDDPSSWPKLKEYVQDILRTYKDDDRILYWCLCNEPENMKAGCDVTDFMPEVYRWAREVGPSQPVSSPIWAIPGIRNAASMKLDLISCALNESDIITFHNYHEPEEVKTFIKILKRFGRPIICEEYMGRTLGSTFEGVLPMLKDENVGAINWGLVNGKCHFHLPWSHKDGDPEPEIWFHDIFHGDHTPFSQEEVAFIKSQTKNK